MNCSRTTFSDLISNSKKKKRGMKFGTRKTKFIVSKKKKKNAKKNKRNPYESLTHSFLCPHLKDLIQNNKNKK
jgi:hypothetical protein